VLISSLARPQDVCIFDSYGIDATKEVLKLLKERLKDSNGKNCRVKIILGTPGVIKERAGLSKVVYSFVMFPELFGLDKRKNFYGVRIFPLPEKTAKEFFKTTKLPRKKIAVPVSRENLQIAKLYVKGRYFKIITFKKDPLEVKKELQKYDYIYIFPDRKLLKLTNLLKLIGWAKENKKILLTGLPDIAKFGVNFVYGVDLKLLAYKLASIAENEPEEKILPCPAKVQKWVH